MKLKPCPFCNGRAKIWRYNGGVRIDCENWQGGDGREHFVGIGAKTEEDAVRLWNREEENA